MKVALIGVGKVGSMTLQYLMPNPNIQQILLINRNNEYSEGIALDTASAFPEFAEKIKCVDFTEASSADIVVITAGGVMKEGESPIDLVNTNKRIVEEIFSQFKLNENSIVIAIPTQVDIITQHIQKITGHPVEKVIGFGGSLDVNRLKYLLSKKIEKNPAEIEAYFIGEHGQRGISIFDEHVSDYESINEEVKNYFKTVISKVGHSTVFGPAKILSELIFAVVEDKNQELCVSTYFEEHGIYLTWPCVIGRDGILEKKNIDLSDFYNFMLSHLISEKKKDV